jgi:hypothetical protein
VSVPWAGVRAGEPGRAAGLRRCRAELERCSPAELISFVRRLDPGLTARDFADAGRQLDRIDDEAFARYNVRPSEISVVRRRIEVWPRTADAARREIQAIESDRQDPRQLLKSAPRPGTPCYES